MGSRDAQVNPYVGEIEAVLAFHTGLGSAEPFRAPAEGACEHVGLRLDGLTLGITLADVAGRVHGAMPVPGSPHAEVAIWRDDVDEACSATTAAGATDPLTGGVRQPPEGGLDPRSGRQSGRVRGAAFGMCGGFRNRRRAGSMASTNRGAP